MKLLSFAVLLCAVLGVSASNSEFRGPEDFIILSVNQENPNVGDEVILSANLLTGFGSPNTVMVIVEGFLNNQKLDLIPSSELYWANTVLLEQAGPNEFEGRVSIVDKSEFERLTVAISLLDSSINDLNELITNTSDPDLKQELIEQRDEALDRRAFFQMELNALDNVLFSTEIIFNVGGGAL